MFLKRPSNVYECVFLVALWEQDRDRAVIVQIGGDIFCFMEGNYFSSLECGWIYFYFVCISYKYM